MGRAYFIWGAKDDSTGEIFMQGGPYYTTTERAYYGAERFIEDRLWDAPRGTHFTLVVVTSMDGFKPEWSEIPGSRIYVKRSSSMGSRSSISRRVREELV